MQPSVIPTFTSTVDKNTVRVTPFRISYVIGSGQEPDVYQFAFGGDVTLAHLEDYMREQFSTTFGVEITSFTFRILMTGLNPVSIDYTVDLIFAQSSAFIPNKQEVDMLVELAFLPPAVQTLLDSFGMLPPESVFMTTQSVEYMPLYDVVVDDDIKLLDIDEGDGAHLSAATKGLISGSAAAVALLAFSLLSRRRRFRKGSLPVTKHSKSEAIPIIMPAYSYCDSRRSNLMHFKDDAGSTTSSDASHKFSLRSNGSSMSSHSSTLSIRAV